MADERKITAFVEVRADDPTRGRVFVTCPFNGGQCSFSVWQRPAQGIMWHWSGPADKPTISPSISCEGGCRVQSWVMNESKKFCVEYTFTDGAVILTEYDDARKFHAILELLDALL